MLEQLANSAAAVLNRNLAASLTARRAAERLEGVSMDVGLAGARAVLRMSVRDGRLGVGSPDGQPAKVSLSGDLPRLVALLGGDHASPGLELRGDPALAEAFARLLKHCRPDPEEELARFTGEVFARQAGDAARAAAQWAGEGAVSLRRSLRDFVQEEARLAPTRVEFEAFAEQVEALRDTVGRLEGRARILRADPEA
ncbi:MAG: SCP2 sterol-binding domain-containing protein [Gammaproteobacteria bacterium]|nr:SCP2 sterol-binding domain-containing protein [Gammaproteobacteria bacterium]